MGVWTRRTPPRTEIDEEEAVSTSVSTTADDDASYEDVLLQGFLPPKQREPRLTRELRRLLWAANPPLEKLVFVTAAELRRLERTLVDEGVRRATISSIRYLAPALFGGGARGAGVRAGAHADADAAGGAELAGASAASSSPPHPPPPPPPPASAPAEHPAAAVRPCAAHRAACPLRRPREVVRQYGAPSAWQLAGRGATKDVYYAMCREPIHLADGSYHGGLVAIAVARASEKVALELSNLQWVARHLRSAHARGGAAGGAHAMLPLDAWEMDAAGHLDAAGSLLPAAAAAAAGPARSRSNSSAPGPARYVYVVFPAGVSLLRLIQRGVTLAWRPAHFERLALQLLLPLAALRRHDAVHRDLKPENTLLLPPSCHAGGARGGGLRALGLAGGALRLLGAEARGGGAEEPGVPSARDLHAAIADWSSLRAYDGREYRGADACDRPLLGTIGYQHFSVFTSAYLGPPWHPKAWDPSSAATRDVFAVGMTLVVSALGTHLADIGPAPSAAATACIGAFVRDNAYAAGHAARAHVSREVCAQWVHLHSADELRSSGCLQAMPAHALAELTQLSDNSPVRARLQQRLGPALCDAALQMLSGGLGAEEAVAHYALADARAELEADAALADAEGVADVAAIAAARARALGLQLSAALPEAVGAVLELAVLELLGVCQRLPMAGLAGRALGPLARRTGLDALGCRALELGGVSVAKLVERSATNAQARAQAQQQPA